MDTRKQNKPDPWDDSRFGTGDTRPPKGESSIIALLLVVVIILTGIASSLGIQNLRLFRELKAQNELNSVPMSFSGEDVQNEDSLSLQQSGDEDPLPLEDVSIQLNRSPESFENFPNDTGLSWQEIYQKNIPSVVSVRSTGWGSTFTGTGVVLTENGYLVTSHHMVQDADEILVQLTDGREFMARLIGADPVSDLAVLYIPAEDLTPAEFGSSEALRVGDAVAAIGDPMGMALRGSMTDGIISAINRDILVADRTMTLLQTSAALSAGNSGGPLINCYGQVVGINTTYLSAFSTTESTDGLSFTVPSATVKEIVDQLIENGYVSGRPTLGFRGDGITTFYQRYYHMPAGLFITEIDEESQSYQAGVRPGDILISLNGEQIMNMDDLNRAIYSHQVGDSLTLILFREDELFSLELTLEEVR